MKKDSLVDVSVLLLFFNRSEPLRQVFAKVREARPARLFLYQDGPRDERDLPGIKACREVVGDVDWECEVHTLFQEKNYGCDPSEYLSQKWAFSLTEKCVVLEDDDVPSVSFFSFCKELLDRYEHDERVWMIQGFNPEGETKDVSEDYFFTTHVSIWGWASWRRVTDTWDGEYSWMENPETVRMMDRYVKEKGIRHDFMRMCRSHKESGRAFYESIFWASLIMGGGIAIAPKRNMIRNIGVVEDSTHYGASLKLLPHGVRRIFRLPAYEAPAPLRHPVTPLEHVAYRRRVYRILGWNAPLVKIGRSLEELLLCLRYGQFGHIFRSIRQRVRKALHLNSYT